MLSSGHSVCMYFILTMISSQDLTTNSECKILLIFVTVFSNLGWVAGGVTNKGLTSFAVTYDFKYSNSDPKYWSKVPGLPDGGRYRASCGKYELNGRAFIAVLGGVKNMITTKGNYGLLEVNFYFMVLKIWLAAFLMIWNLCLVHVISTERRMTNLVLNVCFDFFS